MNLIKNTENELVLAFDAPWGEGKSTFIRMWQGLLKEKEVPHVYFDAFENDYQTDPFLAISSQIYSLIDKDDEENHKEFKDCLARLGEKLGGDSPVIFIIDELDRCKPKFALSLIESIKHLFSVPNITFVLVMNRNQLEEAVRCEYGREVDASRYLQKFVSIWTSLPKSNSRCASVPKTYLKYCLQKMDYPFSSNDQTIVFFQELVDHYTLSLRDIEKSLTSFAIICNANSGNLSYDNFILAIFLSVTKAINPQVYRCLSSDQITYEALLQKTNLEKLKDEWDEDKAEGHLIKRILKYCLVSQEEADNLLRQDDYFDYKYNRVLQRDAVIDICLWLETFSRD